MKHNIKAAAKKNRMSKNRMSKNMILVIYTLYIMRLDEGIAFISPVVISYIICNSSVRHISELLNNIGSFFVCLL
jgi:uncharacterized membrane protein